MDGDHGKQQSKKSRGLRAAALRGGLGPDPARLSRGGTPKLFVTHNRVATQMEGRDMPSTSFRVSSATRAESFDDRRHPLL